MKRFSVVAWALLAAGVLIVAPRILPTGSHFDAPWESLLFSGRFVAAAGAIFVAGLLTAATPCVYPLIPITVGVFGARQAESRGKALLLTSSYVLGMAAVFSALGVTAARAGQAFGSQLGQPWVAALLAVMMLTLAASLFGAFELSLPAPLLHRLHRVGGAGYAGAFLMGSVSGFLAAPCTGPVLSGLLAFVAKSQSAFLGGALLFIYALGFGVPFFWLGAFAARLPKAGVWTERVKGVLGVALVALAATYVKDASPVFRASASALASHLGPSGAVWSAAGLLMVGLFIGAVHRSFKEGSASAALKGIGILAVAAAVLLRLSALDVAARPVTSTAVGGEGSSLRWHYTLRPDASSLSEFEGALEQARSQGRPVMIDFFAEWCAACKELERYTYVAPQVSSELGRFTNIKVDATDTTEVIDALQKRFDIVGLPTVVFFSSTGQVLTEPRVLGFMEAGPFLAELQKVP
ncbi:MAG TPA: cytochrome c biogenesis protein CcdA [Myxococcaceae bacterium]|nr:cytochrome c biogenesis protein CcdA [Myxococcaceae bacterium]